MALKVGFVGVGGIARRHLESSKRRPDIQMVGYCDVDLERARRCAAEFGGSAYQHFADLYDKEKPDAIVICTPPFAHGDIELACCDLGLHMLIEKPVAIDVEMAKPILAAVKQSGVATVVAYKYRWDDHVNKAREMLADKVIGLVHGDFWGGLPGTPWWRVMAESGGQFVEQTTHIVDMARYLCGEIEAVQALYALRGLQDVENLDVPDVGTVNVAFASGAVGNISNTCMLQGWGTSGLRVMAKGFTLEVRGNLLSWAGAEGSDSFTQTQDGYMGEDVAFVEAIKGNRSLINADYADGVKTLAVTVAANLSATEGGRLVKVSEVG